MSALLVQPTFSDLHSAGDFIKVVPKLADLGLIPSRQDYNGWWVFCDTEARARISCLPVLEVRSLKKPARTYVRAKGKWMTMKQEIVSVSIPVILERVPAQLRGWRNADAK